MHKRFVLFLLFVIFACCDLHALALNTTDSAEITVRHFDSTALEKYKADKDFNYTTVLEEEHPGFFSYLLAFFLQKLFGSSVGGLDLSDIIVFALMLFAAVMLVIQVFKVRSTGMFSKNAEQLKGFTIETEHIEKEQFDKLIEEAKANGNYRLAVRLHYLKTLRALSDAGLIKWQRNKTNFEYYYELRGEGLRNEFYLLTVLFESAWYGHREISAEDFSGAASSFNSFSSLIKRHT